MKNTLSTITAIIALASISSAQVPGIINYQGRVAVGGTNFNGTGQFKFALVNSTGSTNYWANDGTAIGQPAAAISTNVTKGLYSVLLGDTTIANMTVSIAPTVFKNTDVRLRAWFNDGVTGFQQLTPDQRIAAVGYALVATSVDPASDVTGKRLNIGVGNTLTGTLATIGGGSNNIASGNYGVVAGGISNTASGVGAVVGGGGYDGTLIAGNKASAPASTVAGGFGNVASGYASTVGGGQGNTATNDVAGVAAGLGNTANGYGAFVGGGEQNKATNDYATIGGGYYNSATGIYASVSGGFTNIAAGSYATVGAGYVNAARGDYSIVGGGANNTASGLEGTISGGFSNTVGVLATVGGGSKNIASGTNSTVSGGATNTASGVLANVGGGVTNTASGDYDVVGGGWNNNASGLSATIAGGEFNIASADWTTVGGGNGNRATNIGATVPGGYNNTAGGTASFAGGSNARALHDGAFVWADDSNTGTNFDSSGANQFLIRAVGGVGIGTTAPRQLLQVGDTATPGSLGMIRLASRSNAGAASRAWDIGVPMGGEDTTGTNYSFVIKDVASASPPQFMLQWGTGRVGIGTNSPTALLQVGGAKCDGSAWANASDRNLKENFTTVDARAVLAKVAALPVSGWNYKRDADTRHIGPMAQDFYTAFQVGPDDTHISTVDESGVALAAIQGLNEIVKDKDARIAELERRLTALEATMQKMSGRTEEKP